MVSIRESEHWQQMIEGEEKRGREKGGKKTTVSPEVGGGSPRLLEGREEGERGYRKAGMVIEKAPEGY